MGREARAIAAAQAAGLAVPEVLISSNEVELLGSAGLVMRRVPGETIARRILRDDRYAPAREVLIGQLASFAAGLHALKPPADLPAPDPLADLVRQARPSSTTTAGCSSWPSTRSARTGRRPREPVTVHGDLRLGNLIVGERGLDAVIDWELVHVGDPAEDLGWLCVQGLAVRRRRPGRGRRHPRGTAGRLPGGGGAEVSAEELRWWEIARHAAVGRHLHNAGLGAPVRRLPLGRAGRDRPAGLPSRSGTCSTLLRPDEAARAAARRPHPCADPRQLAGPHGRPTASELLDAVRGYLTDQVMPATSGQLAFHARVAANVLAIVARELDLGPPPEHASLADEVAARLAVANPRYF